MNKLLHDLPQPMTHALLVCPVTLSLLLVLFQCVENHSHRLVAPSHEFYKLIFSPSSYYKCVVPCTSESWGIDPPKAAVSFSKCCSILSILGRRVVDLEHPDHI